MGEIINMDKDAISLEEAAQILGLKYSTAYKLIMIEQRIPHYRYSKRKIAVNRKGLFDFKKAQYVPAKYAI